MRLKEKSSFLILVLLLSVATAFFLQPKAVGGEVSSGLYFGVDVAFERLDETLRIVDEVSSYTNLFIIGCYGPLIHSNNSRPIYNETRLDFISQYVYDKGLSFMVYSDDPHYPSAQWLNAAESRFGDKFLGIYYYDEPGGKQLDQANYPAFYYAENFNDAANRYVNTIDWWLRNGSFSIAKMAQQDDIKFFTSDYALYWFDYKAGYNTVFAEYGWNSGWEDYSRQLNVALVRGAATAMNKDWGIMITWAYQQPPYMESGPNLYQDMISAYQNGAKYIIVFDANKDWTENVLQQEHFDAMKQFWDYAQANPRTAIPVSTRSAYVLPEDYGEGFRNPDDTIWGLWRSDFNPDQGSENFTSNVRMSIASLLQTYGPNLDIIYPDNNQNIESLGYQNILHWNDPKLIPNAQPMPPQTPAGNQSAWSLHTPTPTVPSTISPNSTATYIIGAALLVSIIILLTVKKFRNSTYPNKNNYLK